MRLNCKRNHYEFKGLSNCLQSYCVELSTDQYNLTQNKTLRKVDKKSTIERKPILELIHNQLPNSQNQFLLIQYLGENQCFPLNLYEQQQILNENYQQFKDSLSTNEGGQSNLEFEHFGESNNVNQWIEQDPEWGYELELFQ